MGVISYISYKMFWVQSLGIRAFRAESSDLLGLGILLVAELLPLQSRKL